MVCCGQERNINKSQFVVICSIVACRSDRYQYKICETIRPIEELDLGRHLYADLQRSEELEYLRECLLKRLWEIVDEQLTDTQRRITHMYFEQGMTQFEISKNLGVTQSSIFKCMFGNANYKKGTKPIFFGGAIKKLIKICSEDAECIRILKEIESSEDEEVKIDEVHARRHVDAIYNKKIGR